MATPETEERLLAVGRAGTAAHVERIVRGWRYVDRKAELRETVRRHASQTLRVYQDEDGMVVVRGRLAPEVGAALMRALAAARESLYQRRRATGAVDAPSDTSYVDGSLEAPTGQQHADALGLIAEAALHHGLDPGAPGERYQVVVHIDGRTSCPAGWESAWTSAMRSTSCIRWQRRPANGGTPRRRLRGSSHIPGARGRTLDAKALDRG